MRDKMRDILGIELNDQPSSYNSFTYNASTRLFPEWQTFDNKISNDLMAFDGVNVQAVCSMLIPELEAVRFPSESSTKTGIYHRVETYTVTTNAAGNAIFVLFPQNIVSVLGFFVYVANDSTLNFGNWCADSGFGGDEWSNESVLCLSG